MRHLMIFLIVLSVSILTTTGQNLREKVSYTNYFGTGISMNHPSCTPFSWQILAHYSIGNRWKIGAGTGVSVYEKALIPLYASAQFDLTTPRKFTPYIIGNIGGAFAPAKEAKGGFYFSPAIGVQLKVSQIVRLNFAIGYELQGLKQVKKYTNEYFKATFEEQLKHHTVTFKVGVTY